MTVVALKALFLFVSSVALSLPLSASETWTRQKAEGHGMYLKIFPKMVPVYPKITQNDAILVPKWS